MPGAGGTKSKETIISIIRTSGGWCTVKCISVYHHTAVTNLLQGTATAHMSYCVIYRSPGGARRWWQWLVVHGGGGGGDGGGVLASVEYVLMVNKCLWHMHSKVC